MRIHPQIRLEPAARRGFHFFRSHIVTLWLVALPFLILLGATRQWSEIEGVLGSLKGADPRWLVVGIAIEALIMLSPALTYQVILRRLGHALPFRALAGMHMQRIVIGTLAPVSGPVSMFAFVRALNQRAVTTHDALTMLALRSVATQGAFIVLLLTAIALRGPVYSLVVAGVVLTVLFGVVPLIRRAHLPACFGPWQWRRLPRSVSTRAIEFAARFRRHQICASDLSRPLAITITSRFAGLLLLVVSIKAMGVEVAPKAIALAIIAEIIAKIAVPFFHGIGVVEAATALALQQSGMPADAAVGAALLWRTFEFWMPFSVALGSQAVSLALARLPRMTLPQVKLPAPQAALAMAKAPALSRRSLAVRTLVVVFAFVLSRFASGSSDVS